MTPSDLDQVRTRLYGTYGAQHAVHATGRTTSWVYRRDIRPALPPGNGRVIDLGCGRGELVRLLLADGFDAEGIDISPEQVRRAHAAGVTRVRHGDYREFLGAQPGRYAAVTATDLLEHLTKPEVLDTFDSVAAALVAGGVFVARVPNAASPLGGHIRHGDFTHESSFTPGSIRQLAAVSGLDLIAVRACPPVVHGVVSALRAALWKPISACWQLALAAETGVLRGNIVTANLTFVAVKPAGR
jgi:SAM-dependent methyltransferase